MMLTSVTQSGVQRGPFFFLGVELVSPWETLKLPFSLKLALAGFHRGHHLPLHLLAGILPESKLAFFPPLFGYLKKKIITQS